MSCATPAVPLPGVSVEAASPVLIEKARTTVTDVSGQYRVVDLRGVVYTITYTLQGFTTVVREGVELAGNAVVTVNVELRLSGVAETITVTIDSWWWMSAPARPSAQAARG